MSAPKRVLLFAPYFLPRRRVGSMRPFRFAIHLREYGWEPTILTIGTPGQTLTDKEAALLREVRILTIDPPFDRTTRSESQLGAAAGRSASAESVRGTGLLNELDRQFPIDTWLPLFAVRFCSLVRMATEIDPDVIWATGDPWSGLVVGRWLSRRLNKPYIADFRDPWTLSEVRTDRRWAVAKMIDRRSERRIVGSADMVMFQAERVEAAYREHYAQLNPATVTIRNSFDPSVFVDPIDVHGRTPARRSAELHIGFFGRFRAMSPATLIVDVLSDLNDRHGGQASRVFVDSFGPLSAADAEYARSRGVASQFIAHDAVPLENALSALRKFDLLLVSTETRRDHIIPAKIFEYLPAGRPILSISRNPEVRDILRRTGTGVQIEGVKPVADLLAASVEALDRGAPLPIPFHPRAEEIMKHDARASTGELARVFDALIGQKSSGPTGYSTRSMSEPKSESAGSER